MSEAPVEAGLAGGGVPAGRPPTDRHSRTEQTASRPGTGPLAAPPAGYRLRDHLIDLPGRRLVIASVAGVEELVQRAQHEDELPFWADLWPAAVGLARHLWRHDLHDQRVLELGAGPGLGGIAAALRGAQVLQTDFIPVALELARYNAARNGLTGGITWRLADWRRFDIEERFDWVVGSDIAYEPAVHRHLYEIAWRCTAAGGRFVLADPGRGVALRLLERFEGGDWSWQVEEVPIPWEGRVVEVHVHTLWPPAAL